MLKQQHGAARFANMRQDKPPPPVDARKTMEQVCTDARKHSHEKQYRHELLEQRFTCTSACAYSCLHRHQCALTHTHTCECACMHSHVRTHTPKCNLQGKVPDYKRIPLSERLNKYNSVGISLEDNHQSRLTSQLLLEFPPRCRVIHSVTSSLKLIPSPQDPLSNFPSRRGAAES